MSYIIHINS